GLYMRLGIEESAVFRAAPEVAAVPAVEAVRTHWRSIVIVFFAEMAQTSYFYLTAIFTISFATRQLGVAKDVITQAVLLANLVAFVAMPAIGAGRTGWDGSGFLLPASCSRQRRCSFFIIWWPRATRCLSPPL